MRVRVRGGGFGLRPKPRLGPELNQKPTGDFKMDSKQNKEMEAKRNVWNKRKDRWNAWKRSQVSQVSK